MNIVEQGRPDLVGSRPKIWASKLLKAQIVNFKFNHSSRYCTRVLP